MKMFKKRKTSSDRKTSSTRNNNASLTTTDSPHHNHPSNSNYNRDLHFSFHHPQCSLKSHSNVNKSGSIQPDRSLFEELHKACYLIEPIPTSTGKNRSQSALANLREFSGPRPHGESPSNNIIGYQYTYRAVLARKGYLVRDTLGSGSYSKVGFVLCLFFFRLIFEYSF